MATARPGGDSGCLFTGYTHDFYVRSVYGRKVGLRHDNGVMPRSVRIPAASRRRLHRHNLTVRDNRGGQKKTGPQRGPVSVFAGVGAGNIFQRGTSCPPVILGGYASGATASMQYANVCAEHQRRPPHVSHAQSQIV